MAIVNKTYKNVIRDNSNPKCGRKEITSVLTNAAIDYYTKLRYGVYKEIGLLRWGKLRADLFCVSMKGEFIGVEVKSCKSDFDTDHKYNNYLQYFDKFYICCPENIVNYIYKKVKKYNVGVFTLGSDGYLYCAKQAKRLQGPDNNERLRLLLKLAWRAADYNKRNRPRRTRRYFSEGK